MVAAGVGGLLFLLINGFAKTGTDKSRTKDVTAVITVIRFIDLMLRIHHILKPQYPSLLRSAILRALKARTVYVSVDGRFVVFG